MFFSIITSTFNQLENLKKIEPHIKAQAEFLHEDYEWIIADDGSSDGTPEWCRERGYKCYHKEKNTGYDLVGALNSAFLLAEGRYIVWVMGDTYPKSDFLFQLYTSIMSTDRGGMFCGVRYDIDWQRDEVISPEWRVQLNQQFPWFKHQPFEIKGHNSFALMTLNSMCMSRADYLDMEGIPVEYTGYGKMDWYMAAWVYYHNKPLWIVPDALVYHRKHEDREDTPHNTKVFEKHIEELRKNV